MLSLTSGIHIETRMLMNKMIIALKKQYRWIQQEKNTTIYTYKGFGVNCILVFGVELSHSEYRSSANPTQKAIDEGYYESIEDFDGYHCADIEFSTEYSGPNMDKYHRQTLKMLIELGKHWRKRVIEEYPEADVTIVLSKQYGHWCLDTYNYPVEIEGGIYL